MSLEAAVGRLPPPPLHPDSSRATYINGRRAPPDSVGRYLVGALAECTHQTGSRRLWPLSRSAADRALLQPWPGVSTTIRSALAPGVRRPRSGRPRASAPPSVAAL